MGDKENGLSQIVFQTESIKKLIGFLILAGTVLSAAFGIVQSYLLKPAFDNMKEERDARVEADTTILRSLRALVKGQERQAVNMDLMAEALRYAPGTTKRAEILRMLDRRTLRPDE